MPLVILALFIGIPVIEIYLFIQVGGWIGLWPTLLIVVVTALLGSWLVRTQGAREMQNLRGAFNDLRDPSEPLASGAMILFAGALLLTPGFFTDAVGFALLIPKVRQAAFRAIKARVNFQSFQMGPGQPGHGPRADWAPEPDRRRRPDDRVIDGEYEPIERDDKTGPRRPSGWTQR